MGSIVSWHIGRKNKGIYDHYPVIFFFFFLFYFYVARELCSPRATLGSAWQQPGAAANVLGLQVLLGTKLDCDLLP